MLDAINLEEAYRRNNEIHQNGFNKGGNQNEARDGEIRRMPVREHELIPETVQTKLDPGHDRIESLDGMLAKLLRESGEVEDLRTVQEASIAQSETFSHSDANELVPWNIARHIRSAPQSLQDAQVALQNYLGLETLEKDELNALNELENWVGVQESVASRERFYGSPEDPDFRERLFSVDRRQRSAPLLPSYAGCTAVLGDSVADLPVAEQWRLLYTLPAILTPLIEPEGCYVTTAVPGVGTSAALLARSLGAELRIINVDAKFHQDFRPFQRTVLNEIDAPFVPEHHEAAALVAMMSASRVFIVTDQPCTSPVMLNGELLHLPVKYAAALREAVTFRGACPNVTVIASKFHPGF
ncbi:hypothetical protein [Deinococcus ruber]|uniref:hypothetical protein n=1 Tax=Deinococcus ruber TaxID=1848197 RepID=UPI00166DE4E1|nr:hypothetical protein [Deinococcus ruber]